MPEEIFAIVMVSILSGTFVTVLKTILKFRMEKFNARNELPQGRTDSGVTSSELRGMIADAVTDATFPLHTKIDELNRQVRALKGPQIEVPAPDTWAGEANPAEAARSRTY